MKIVFMGTPEYSVRTLEVLSENNYNIAAVFSQPDKPVGRKKILTAPPVKVCAEKLGIKVYQPSTLKSEEAYDILKEINPDVIVVVAYGKILPQEILNIPRLGCVNGHASLLPFYRGASPIQWSIVCGEKVTGITTMFMDKGMDTGDILESVSVNIGEEETADELFERLSVKSAELMVSTLKKLEKGLLKPVEQDENKATYAPIIKKEMALLDFNKSAEEVHNAVRGYYSWPCAYFMLNGKRVKVIDSRVGEYTDKSPCTVIGNTDELIIACGNGTSIKLLNVQPEGSNKMTSKQMLCGNHIALGTVIKEK